MYKIVNGEYNSLYVAFDTIFDIKRTITIFIREIPLTISNYLTVVVFFRKKEHTKIILKIKQSITHVLFSLIKINTIMTVTAITSLIRKSKLY